MKSKKSIVSDIDRAIIKMAHQGQTNLVKALVKAGADIHVSDDGPFRVAVRQGHIETVKYLLSIGAKVDVKDDWALRVAIEENNVEMVKLLTCS